MAAFLKIDGIDGEATDSDHQEWILMQSMDSTVTRSIPEGAKDSQRSRGATTLEAVNIIRELDKSSVKLMEACANGTYFDTMEIHFCTQMKNHQEPYLKYVLMNVIVSSHNLSSNADGDPVPTEAVTLSYTEAHWEYVVIDKTGSPTGMVAGSFNPGTGSTA